MFSEATEYVDILFAMLAGVTPTRTGADGGVLDHSRVFPTFGTPIMYILHDGSVVLLRPQSSQNFSEAVPREAVPKTSKTLGGGRIGFAGQRGYSLSNMLVSYYNPYNPRACRT